ncbi:hypothetical protein [Nodosilinea nodulosa]|uniref:hypothetical protein n=1 Tax=Nodosilinea nodulosa TaxID=416001 RepID=UPI000314484A|nr:hypothetical protein [Nodosilinea nodulosa]
MLPFHERLSSVDASWQDDFTLKEMVKKSLKPISKARRYKVSWEKIALMLQDATGGELDISAASVRQYYFELTDKSANKEKTNKPKPKPIKPEKKPNPVEGQELNSQGINPELESLDIPENSGEEPNLNSSEFIENPSPIPEKRSGKLTPNSSDSLPANPQETPEKSQRKPQSKIQSSFNLRRP